MAITINGSGTIGGVSVGGLPDGIVDTDMLASAAVTSAKVGSLSTSNLPAGSALQVVQTVYSTDVTVTSTSFQDTQLSASITPISASSKILIFVTQPALIYQGSNAGISGGMKLLRGATGIVEHNITPAISAGTGLGGDIAIRTVWSFCYLDSPNTTSSTTYKTQGKVNSTANSGQIRFQQNNTEEASITLMEIAA